MTERIEKMALIVRPSLLLKYMRAVLRVLIIIWISESHCNGQELKIVEFRHAPLDISARENAVYDPNGDACSIIKIRLGINNAKFSSDLEIRKTEWHNGEYWLWVSPGTKKIYVEAPDFPGIDYELPKSAEALNVYILTFSAEVPDHSEIEYKTLHSVSFKTKPDKAKIYINDFYYGKSPLILTPPLDTFEYRVEKRTCLPEIRSDIIKNIDLEYIICLKKDTMARRFYAMVPVGFSPKWRGLITGINMGFFGRTGVYGSYYFSKPYTDYGGFTNVDDHSEIPDSAQTFSNRQRLCLGITKQLDSFSFINFGIGYGSSEYYYKTGNEYYRLSYGYSPENSPLEIVYKGSFNNVIINSGFSIRIKNRILFSFNAVFTILESFNPERKILECYGGVGYHF